MGRLVGELNFNIGAGDTYSGAISGTRVCVAECSASAVKVSIDGQPAFTLAAKVSVKLPLVATRVSITSVDGAAVSGRLYYGEAELDMSGMAQAASGGGTTALLEVPAGCVYVAISRTTSSSLVATGANTAGIEVYHLAVKANDALADGGWSIQTVGADPFGAAVYPGTTWSSLPQPLKFPAGVGLSMVVNAGTVGFEAIYRLL